MHTATTTSDPAKRPTGPIPALLSTSATHGFDLRRLVVIATLAAIVVGSLSMVALILPAEQSSDMVRRLQDELQPPKDHLIAAERASENALATMNAAVLATGQDRTDLLTEALGYSELLTSEWEKYESSHVGLPGERRLMERFRRDEEESAAITSAALVPILSASEAAAVPAEVTTAVERTRQDLIALHSLYRRADRAALADLRGHTNRFELMVASGGLLAALTIVVGGVVGMRRARRAMGERSRRRELAGLAEFETRLRRALEFVDNETAAFEVADRAVRDVLPEARTSILVADSSRARLVAVRDEPTCGVTTPEECPAMRAGSALVFPDSTQLDACPVLAARTDGACSATCVPITVAGRGAALMHLAGPVDEPPDRDGEADIVARGLGERVTLLQAFATFQLQAERDPLTGLLNRRSLETAVAKIVDSGAPYAVAFGDLDHFKRLNDLHGHDAGDRALRAFARVLRESLRPEDVCCRWGGEEFVVVLPGCDTAVALDAMDRVRTNLALGSMSQQASTVTVSFGVASSSDASSFDEVVEHADQALRVAKDSGRNRAVAYDPLGRLTPA